MEGQQAPGGAVTGRRPRQRRVSRGDLREEALVAAAEELLRDHPPERITMETIAAAAGLSRSSVYFYFDNKNTVLAAVVHRGISRLLAGLEEALAAEAEPPVGAVVERLLAVILDNWRSYDFVFVAGAGLLSREPAVRAVYDSLCGRAARLLAEAVGRDRARGVPVEGAEDSDELRALALTWMTERTFHQLFSRKHTVAEEESTADALAFLIRRGLGYP
ncbi:TetR/AcrR family transcriptional regulator [Streptomyces johnsoniae]|uniref:TetR/AcrR family transcriptional regulator n=1 Tax=Streptomyces johnsoniae TaxID=3075532 RepID=A0ABU2S7G7_9ACTN|nr:TetR/AcrR family transcriptional regulator [Streptomyces sp. DSM 41886]MDT0444862.1 TetR/AcrR family transcriptional regulator [Streptomyces sp. DSM 41886]